MPPQDEEFIKRLRATFQVEAEEHLQAIATHLLVLEKSPPAAEQRAAIESVYREAHSLKGAARAVDLSDIETICQAMETAFSAWKRHPVTPSPSALDVLHKSLDLMRIMLAGSGAAQGSHTQARDTLLSQLARLESADTLSVKMPDARVSDDKTSNAPPTTVAADVERITSDTVRISIAKLDAQLLRAEDLLPLKALTAQRARELRELTTMLEQWQGRWTKISPEARAIYQSGEQKGIPSAAPSGLSRKLSEFFEWNADFHRSLENKLRILTAQTERDRHSVGKRLDELLEDSKKLLMLPFSTIAGVLPKIVRDLCREQGKAADLVIYGGDIEIDKRILEEMKDALIHVLRNSVDHGIESLAERDRYHKPQRGLITIAVSQVNGSKVEILISDDGRGIDLDALKEAAVRIGSRSATDMPNLSEAEALNLIFDSEISTSRIVTTVSGRGLGMAIVRSKVEKLSGEIALKSTRHVGTTLQILLPLTLATFRGILVTAADRTFVIPAANIERVLRIRPANIQTVENRETISAEGRIFSLVRLASVLELPAATRPRDVSAPIPVMILRAAGECIAFAVDEVLHEEEVLVKPLRKPLVRVRNIGGATILGSGRAVPTLNISDLIQSARLHQAPAPQAKISLTPATPAKHVLVVEDSITSRMLLKGILESAGYHVQVAVDGMDAFTQLREATFDLVVSDVEMPRLNGFDLTAKIRADKRLAELPIVLVTALESRAQRERGIEVGANAYIIKSSFDQSNLLEVVRRLI